MREVRDTSLLSGSPKYSLLRAAPNLHLPLRPKRHSTRKQDFHLRSESCATSMPALLLRELLHCAAHSQAELVAAHAATQAQRVERVGGQSMH